MDVRNITPNVSVSAQIALEDLAAVAAMGFKTVVLNRPDGEEPGQPSAAEMGEAARAAGLEVLVIPVAPGQPTDAQALELREAFPSVGKPLLAMCRSGMRSSMLWALAARDRLSTDEVIRMALTAGHDLEPMRERLEAMR